MATPWRFYLRDTHRYLFNLGHADSNRKPRLKDVLASDSWREFGEVCGLPRELELIIQGGDGISRLVASSPLDLVTHPLPLSNVKGHSRGGKKKTLRFEHQEEFSLLEGGSSIRICLKSPQSSSDVYCFPDTFFL